MADWNPEVAPLRMHDQVPEAVAEAPAGAVKVPPKLHEVPVGPIPLTLKLPLPLETFSVPVPEPGTDAVIIEPLTTSASGLGPIGHEVPLVVPWLPLKVPE